MKYLIFDFDGVLGDTLDSFVKVIKENVWREKTEEEIKDYMQGIHDAPLFKRDSGKKTKVPIEERIERGEQLKKYGFPMFDGFVEEIEKLEDKKMAVVSSGAGGYVKQACLSTGLEFTHILDGEDHLSKETKIEWICKDWGVSVKDIYFFTDTKSDILELIDFLDKSKIFGCSWGWHGQKKLSEVLPNTQVLKEFEDIRKIKFE